MKNKLIKMFEMQDDFNKVVHPDWKNQNFKFTDAIMVEGVEALEHYGWKWWKKQTPDIAQVKMELVDIWHFAMSEKMTFKNYEVNSFVDNICWSIENDSAYDKFGLDFQVYIRSLVEDAASGYFSFPTFYRCMLSVQMDMDELFAMYVGKNTLNKFRQDNGYKTGDYYKDWNGEEDNVVLDRIMKTLDMNSDDIVHNVYVRLSEEYVKVK